MNKIVLDHYPAANLPDDLRRGLETAGIVRITIEVTERSSHPSPAVGAPVPKLGLFSADRALAKPRFTSMEDIDDHVRALREEWSGRPLTMIGGSSMRRRAARSMG